MENDEYPYKFKPTPELTAYQLAMIFVSDGGLNADEEVYRRFPEDVKKYYTMEKKND